MTYTQKDIQFLQFLKSQGVEKDQAFSILEEAKMKAGATQGNQQTTPNTGKNNLGGFASKALQSFAPNLANTAKNVAVAAQQATRAIQENPQAFEAYKASPQGQEAAERQQIIRDVAGSNVDKARNLENVSLENLRKVKGFEGSKRGQVLRGASSSLAGTIGNTVGFGRRGLEKITGKEFEQPQIEKIKDFSREISQEGTGLEKAAKIGTDIAQFFAPAGASAKAANALSKTKTLSKAPAIVKNTLPLALTEGTTAAAVTAAQTGDVGKEEAVAGVLGALFPAIGGAWRTFKGTDKLLQKAPNPKIVEKARKAGVSDADIGTILNLSDEQKQIAREFLKASQKRATEKVTKGKVNKGAFGKVGNDINAFVKEVSKLKQKAGKKVGKESLNIKDKAKIKLDEPRDLLKQALEDAGVIVRKNGTLNFSKTRFDGLSGDIRIIKDAWRFAKKKRGQDPLTILEKVRNLDAKLGAGKAKIEIGPATRIVKKFRDSLDETVTSLPGKLGDAKKEFSQLAGALEKVQKLIGKEGEKGEDIARRLFGNASGKTENVFNLIQDISEKFNIKAGKDLINKSAIADVTESAAGAIGSRSLAGGVQAGTRAAFNAASGRGLGDLILLPLEAVAKRIFPKLPKDEAVRRLINSQAQGGKSIKDILFDLGMKSAISLPSTTRGTRQK